MFSTFDSAKTCESQHSADNNVDTRKRKMQDRQQAADNDQWTSTIDDFIRRPITILSRRYPLTKTNYKFIDIGITVNSPSYVHIIIGDCHGKEILLSHETWKGLVNQKCTILSHLRNGDYVNNPPPSLLVGNVNVRFGKINNLPVLRLDTSTIRLVMSLNTVLVMFDLEHCVNRIVTALNAAVKNVDVKFSRFTNIASTVTDPALISQAIRDSDSYDSNDIIDCELASLCF